METQEFQFCCTELKSHIEGGDLHLHFDPKFREIGIGYSDDGMSIQLIRYCPWCASALPSSLRNAWFDELDALGLDPDGDLPTIYRTDEWWRKKSLS